MQPRIPFFLLLLLLMMGGPAAAASLPDAPYVSTSATAVDEVAPDFAVLNMQFRTVQDSPGEVRARTDEAQQRLLELLDGFDDAIRDRRVESMEFGEEFEYDRHSGQRVQVGHFGAFSVRLEVDDFDRLPTLHYRLAGLQWRSLDNPQFRVDDPQAVENRLRQQAMVQARDRARSLAEAGGAGLAGLWGVIHQPMHDLAGRLMEDASGMSPLRVAVGEADGRFAMSVEPRPIRFEVTVGVVYGIREATGE